MTVEIVPFRSEDRDAVRNLILAGQEEHWGYLDASKNPDLRDIEAFYAQGIFLVAWLDGTIVGTGAFLPRSDDTLAIVRMSVAKSYRRQGIGRRTLCALCRQAYENGYKSVILEMTETWHGVIAFYQAFGFQITHYTDGDVYFVLGLREFFEETKAYQTDGGSLFVTHVPFKACHLKVTGEKKSANQN